jgi:hypothetical protein
MLGQIQEWFYHDLAGIQNAPGSAGFERIVIRPQPVGDVTWVKARYESIRGRIVSYWKREGRRFTLEATIPANTTATIYLPATSASAVKAPSGATFVRMENGEAVYEIGSGRHLFRTTF